MTASPIEMPGRRSIPVLSLPEAPSPTMTPADALYQPLPSDVYAPPLNIAVRLARQDLAVLQNANIQDHTAMVTAATVLEIRLRQLLDALDADSARTVRPLAERQDGVA
jgi:hypothetical protein